MHDRRNFLSHMAATTLAAGAFGATHCQSSLANAAQADRTQPEIAVFAKHVQTMDSGELGRRLKAIGCQGIEATLRRGGQINPQDLERQLGSLVDALAAHDQRVLIAASDVNEVNQESEQYIAQLAKYSIPYLRMAYYKYDFEQPIQPQLEKFALKAKGLASLCAAHGVTALYQNHAGKAYVGAALWDLREILQGIDNSGMAVAVDIRHTTLELSQSYQAGYQVIRPWMGATYVKDFDWINGKPENVPLGKGRAKPLFDLIKKDGFKGPLSLHMEYTDHRDPTQVEASWEAIESDVSTLQRWLD